MIACTNAWVNAHKEPLVSETNVELTLWAATDPAYVSSVDGGEDQASFSKPDEVLDYAGYRGMRPTLERNIWALDGLGYPNAYNAGFVGGESESATLTITLSQPSVAPIPGLTIIWSDYESLGHATAFMIVAKKDGVEVMNKIYLSNTKNSVSDASFEVASYDTIEITVTGWSIPCRRPRISGVYLGQKLIFTKKDILSYEHEQIGHPNSGAITQNVIRFSLDNFGGQWHLSNPSGITKYLTERLRVDVRYGTKINGVTQWIPAGTFFLSEWGAPASGHEATFSARDAMGFLTNEVYEYEKTSTLGNMARNIVEKVRGQGFSVDLDCERVDTMGFVAPDPKATGAEVLQMCANATCCLIRYPRNIPGRVVIAPDSGQTMDYTILSNLSYSYPDVELSKPLKEVSVAYGEDTRYVLSVAQTGETQTVDNPLVVNEGQAKKIAEWVKSTMEARTNVAGEFRADPRLDVYDIVTVEGKYGEIYPVMITYLKYTYTGSFKANYEGRVLTNYEEAQLCWD